MQNEIKNQNPIKQEQTQTKQSTKQSINQKKIFFLTEQCR